MSIGARPQKEIDAKLCLNATASSLRYCCADIRFISRASRKMVELQHNCIGAELKECIGTRHAKIKARTKAKIKAPETSTTRFGHQFLYLLYISIVVTPYTPGLLVTAHASSSLRLLATKLSSQMTTVIAVGPSKVHSPLVPSENVSYGPQKLVRKIYRR